MSGIFQTPLQAQEDTATGSLFIIGGGSRPVEMLDRIIKESGIKETGYAYILPLASAERDSAIYYAQRQFTNLGLKNVRGLLYTENGQPTPQQIDSIRNARLIYITGGDQDRFMKAIENTPIAEAIFQNYHNGGMIAGTSAGAAIMSKDMITGTELKHPDYNSTFRHLESGNLELKPGLGLIENVIIDQHFVRRSRYNRLLTAVIDNPAIQGIGIDEATAILVKGKEAEVVGDSQVIVFSNVQNSNNTKNGKLAATGIRMDIYLNGDKFSLE
ncbi:cyanophycinase [Antarcticibacterium arcticum]|uniref:Cyanophycinase n=2 Tax=Antarcticibacterium arcticum TaxID=2585771 RepID=A0A5B8YNP1_9FLAO|nr:cyanophycinase [Antarcticibacterium arcticum]